MYINTGVEYPPHWCRRQIQAKAPPEDVVGQAAIRLGLVVVSPRFKTESKEEDVKTIVMQVIKATGMKEKHVVDYTAIPITHVFSGIWRHKDKRQIRQISEHAKI